MNRSDMHKIFPYILVGVVLWVAVLQSGVHATIAGVLLAFFIPLPAAKKLIHNLHSWVAFGVMPLFAFANAGVPLAGVTAEQLLMPMPLGIILALFWGKQIGIFFFAWGAIKLRLANKPHNTSWFELYAISIIAGIGFTMSLFIGGLAFVDPKMQADMRLGVMIGSLLSLIFGVLAILASIRLKTLKLSKA